MANGDTTENLQPLVWGSSVWGNFLCVYVCFSLLLMLACLILEISHRLSFTDSDIFTRNTIL